MRRTADEAGLNKESEQQAPPPKLTLSSTFQSSDADIVLRSKDGTPYLVHRANLGASSSMLAEMLASVPAETQGGRPIIHLEEDSAVLDRMLPYCYPQQAEPVDPEPWAWETSLPLLTALDKYKVERGIESFASEFRQLVPSNPYDDAPSMRPSYPHALQAFAFARHFNFSDLASRAWDALLGATVDLQSVFESFSAVGLGPLATSTNVERLALSVLGYLHDIRRYHELRRRVYIKKIARHGHLDHREEGFYSAEAMDELREFATPAAINASLERVEYWDCTRCMDAFEEVGSVLLRQVESVERRYWPEWSLEEE